MIAAAIGAGVCASAVLAWAVRAPSSSLLVPVVHRGAQDRPWLALTFDDGPSEGTPQVLDTLDRLRVPATFFQCGAWAARLPGVAREVAERGHEIGNHSYSHSALYLRGANYIAHEIRQGQVAIAKASGRTPRIFRPPYGARWFGMRRAVKQAGLQTVTWTVIGLDWKWNAVRVAERLLTHTVNGAIFCLHDGREGARNPDLRATIGALERTVPVLLDRGYAFKTVSDLLCQT